MLKIQTKNINELKKYENNARLHSQEQIEQIANSIKEFGFTNPILIDLDNKIIAGHGRLEACYLLGLKEIPCIVLENLNEAQKRALIIADNKIALNASWDEDLLKLELIELDEMDFDYSNLGFDFDIDIDEINDEEFKPNLKEQKYSEKFEIVIECENELEQESIFYKLTNEGIKCRVQSL